MRIGDTALKSVAFIAAPDPEDGEPSYGGTAFFVKHIDNEGCGGSYLVTAKHVAAQVDGSDFILRMGSVKQEIRDAKWHYLTSDPSVDVAVLEFFPPVDSGCVRFATKHFLTRFKMGSKRIGPGDQAHIVGLYRLHPGEQKNRVVVHTGHIAMMPDTEERFSVGNWPQQVEGYALEAQTLEGLSGSPVYVRRSIMVMPIEHTGAPPLAYGATFLLGLWMASWEGIPDKEKSKELRGDTADKSRQNPFRVPAGMGVVVPAYDILRVLDMEELQDIRRVRRNQAQQENAASLDSALPTTDENPQHNEDFNRLLDAAVRGEK